MPWDPALPETPLLEWIHKQEPYIFFSRPGGGARLLHLHANGNWLIDISEVSQLFYYHYDSFSTIPFGRERDPEKTTIYFEFDQHDARYRSISSLLVYLINMLVWRFWPGCDELISGELEFLSRMNSWSLEDQFHVYSILRDCSRATTALTIFISRFDHCPKEQREWFLGRILEEQSYSDTSYRIIVSTSDESDLGASAFPDEARINLDDSPVIQGSKEGFEKVFRMMPNGLVDKRPVYETFQSSIEDVVEELGDPPFMGQIIISWLLKNLRGKSKSAIAGTISQFSPPTAHNVVKTFIFSLDSKRQKKAETIFNWVKHAAEPWSPESLTEALAVYEMGNEEPSFEDLDVESTIKELDDVFGGIIVVNNGNVRFFHDAIYMVPTMGIEGSEEEATAMVNGTIAKTCLRYLQLSHAQRALAKLFDNNSNAEGSPWATELDTAIIYRDRTSMAVYAVEFWPHHYKLSGQFRPRELVHEFFASTTARASWAIPHWLLSNPFTRMQRSYVSTLPTFAMLGLEDLVQQKVQEVEEQQDFAKDCWYAITEAARSGHRVIVQQLLEKTAVDADELQVALHWAAACQDQEILNLLLDKIPKPETFQWPEDIIHQAAAAGLNDLLAFMLSAGHNIDEEVCDFYWGAPVAVIVAWRNRVSTMEFLLGSEHKPDLTLKDESTGDDTLTTAADKGIPRMVELLLQNGANVETVNSSGKRPIQRAAQESNFKVIELLIKAEADFKSGSKEPHSFGPPLFVAATSGSRECVRVLLAAGADPVVESSDGVTALYEAVAGSDADIVRELLEHDPKLDVEKAPPGQVTPLMRAIGLQNTELVSLLLEHGAAVNFADKNSVGLNQTPLSLACIQGNLDIVKLLLAKGADVNYTEGRSDAPLLAATAGSLAVTKHLLLEDTIDVKWTASDGTTALHMASFDPTLVREFLERGAHIDAHSETFGTTLHKATRSNRIQTIKALLANDPKPDIDFVYGDDGWEEDEIGFTALQLACKHGLPECVKVLLKGGANPRFRNKDGEDAIDVIIRTQTDSQNALECLRVLQSVPYSIPVDEVSDQGASRLHGIQEKTPVSIVQQLVDANAPFDTPNQEGHSPLSIAVSKGNNDVVRYLVEQGAHVNRFGPSFGSILHIAVSKGSLSIVELLLDSGAELDTVHSEYGESLLYTALGIENMAKLKAIVRLLVEGAKAPINKLGGVQFSYPIIRAANLARSSSDSSASVLKFLVQHNADLNVADSQGRRAVHIASASWWDDAVKALAKAGAETDVRDALGRKPIHFAASASWSDCFEYLVDKHPDSDINEADHDGWTPLMWAARSGSSTTIEILFRKDAEVWVRSCDSNLKDEWSALKLLNFLGPLDPEAGLRLEFKARSRPRTENGMEEWDDPFHKIAKGHKKSVRCNSCFVVSHIPLPLTRHSSVTLTLRVNRAFEASNGSASHVMTTSRFASSASTASPVYTMQSTNSRALNPCMSAIHHHQASGTMAKAAITMKRTMLIRKRPKFRTKRLLTMGMMMLHGFATRAPQSST
jgi:ankyrin repeat protein